MPFEMDRQIHLVFGVMETEIDVPRRQDQPRHLDEGAAGKPEQSDVGHWVLQCRRRTKDLRRLDIRQKPSAQRAGSSAVLGRLPWISRATAMWPDARYMANAGARVKEHRASG